MPTQEKKIEFKDLQKRLQSDKKLSNYYYRGERTFVVVSGMNSDSFNLSQVVGLNYYEERMLFLLFLLKYKRTKMIYVTSKGFNTDLFDYYVDLVADDEKEARKMKSRLTHIAVNHETDSAIPLTDRLLADKNALREIVEHISNKKTAVLRCYFPSKSERKLAVELGIPLFGSKEKFDFIGTKSGGRKVFRLAGLNVIPGYSYLENFSALSEAMAKLMKNYPYYKKMVIKLNEGASGRGNCVFNVKDFLKENDIEISINTNVEKLAQTIKKNFKQYLSFQQSGEESVSYIRKFNKLGGIVELFIDGNIKFSPSVQVSISASNQASIVSTHEQILGGPDKQKYLGCSFPSLPSHRKLITSEAKKVADWMAKKGMIGHFGIDFIVVKNENSNKIKTYPIEINLRKGGTTHPFRIAYYLTRARYNNKEGLLKCGKVPIHYLAMDLIESDKYCGSDPMKLVRLVRKSKISFNENTKKGALVYMPGLVQKYGKFGAICIGHSDEEAKILYNKMIKLINSKVERLK